MRLLFLFLDSRLEHCEVGYTKCPFGTFTCLVYDINEYLTFSHLMEGFVVCFVRYALGGVCAFE